ncbi:hypothetical protein VB713_10450 [Anabaena cylindrica UHCC 0172]|uniref:hypothetical protein n=1 Tax=Anabaena cylindrica TaxID=1165 RepID=UPI002B2159DD|nr:hypothetical protein [Anabaena cylindrica]MEA5551392.1 hypothetical protein [Anabaena cylindrica UHCC 0172]
MAIGKRCCKQFTSFDEDTRGLTSLNLTRDPQVVPEFSQNRGSALNNEFKAEVGAFSANLKDDIA